MRVLVVDDDPDVLDILSLSLEMMGNHDVSKCSSARQAMAAIQTAPEPFETFLLDIQMPEINGVELCRMIREIPVYQFTPILMVTAMSDKSHIEHSFAAGATDYVSKPIDFTDLKHRIGLAEKSAFQTEQLSGEIRQLAASSSPASDTLVSLQEAIPIDNVDGVLRVHAFENYLKQMSRLEFHHVRLLLVSVTNIASIYEHCNRRQFVDQVTDIAEGLTDAFAGSAPFVAYFGRGIYVVALTSQSDITEEEAEVRIDSAIQNLGMVYHTGEPVFLSIEVKAMQKLSLLSLESSGTFIDKFFRELKLAVHSSRPDVAAPLH